MEKYLKNFKNCLQKEPAFCRAECPFDLDVVDFIEKSKKERLSAAYKIYKNAVGFPFIVSTLCPEYCKEACPMREPINLKKIEEGIVTFAKNKEPADYNLPIKNKKIAIIGAGLSGMGCALRLATKKYDVTIFEKTDQIGGQLKNYDDYPIFLDDINFQLKHEEYTMKTHTEINGLNQITGFDAILVATGKAGNDFGILKKANNHNCYEEASIGYFIAGEVLDLEPMKALAHGLEMATSIDNFLKTGSLVEPKPKMKTKCQLDSSFDLNPKEIKSAGPYSLAEMLEEVNRCIQCHCNPCRLYCDVTHYYNKWPLRIRDEIKATTLPGFSEVKATPAKRLISTCTFCGLCEETCPEDIDIGGLILEARKSMHRQGKMAPAYNEFFLRDMDFTNGPLSHLARPAKGNEACQYAFFPGCQLGASDPDLVFKSYEYLLTKEPDMGMFLACCSVPALWAGDDERHEAALWEINQTWEKLGKPTLILACPNCKKHFKEYLPHINTSFMYDMMVDDLNRSPLDKELVAVFDPCTTAKEDKVREVVRTITSTLGHPMEPLHMQENYSACCSYGGQSQIASPEFVSMVRANRVKESPLPYVSYCINCRDSFLQEGKKSFHILDLFFNLTPSLVTVTARRDNRIVLKERLLKEFWSESMNQNIAKEDFNLEISHKLKDKLSKEHILEEDMKEVIKFCQRTKRAVYNEENKTYSGYKKIGHGTYWAEYEVIPHGFKLVNGYSHRMEIEMEVIWNGEKTDPDMY